MQAAWQHLVGRTIEGRYRVTHFIDAGSYGGVFQADEVVGDMLMRSIALKLLRPPAENRLGQPPTPEQRDALVDAQLAELQLASRLEHPHLIRSYSVGMTELEAPVPAGLAGELLYIVMELGEATLAELLRAGPLQPGEAFALARELAAVLHYLHAEAELPAAQRLAHRDLKPANVLRVPSLRGGARWKLSDLGTVRAIGDAESSGGSRLGTLEYAPPEAGETDSGPAWDIWSLGVMLCEALSGTLPFGPSDGTGDAAALRQAVLRDQPRLPRPCPAQFERLLPACLEKDPRRRPSAQQVLAMLEQTGAAHAVPPPAVTASPRPVVQPGAAALATDGQTQDTPAERQLRLAFQRALEDQVLSAYERTELNELRKRLDIRLERAAAIAREELARNTADAAAPLVAAPAPSAPRLAQPASALPAPDPQSFRRVNLTQPPAAGQAVMPQPVAVATQQLQFVVDADQMRPAQFRRIAEAIAAAPSGSRIQIRTGVYREHLVLDKPLELVGYDAQALVQIVSPDRHALIVNCDGVVLKRLRVSAGQPGSGTTSDLAVSALVLSRGRLEADDCCFECTSENCVAVFGATSLAILRRCEISGGRSVGLSAAHDARAVAEHCSIHGNGLAGASCSNGGHLRLSSSRIFQCAGYGVLVYVEGIAALRECEILENGSDGVALKNGGRAEIDRCRINTNRGAGVLVQAGCAASVKGCNLTRNVGRAFNAQRGATLVREANVE